jgi:hypothetical protein
MCVPVNTQELMVKPFRTDRVKVFLVLDIAMPCPLLDLEVHDAIGTHTLDATRSIMKQRLDASGLGVAEGKEVVTGLDGSSVKVKVQHHQVHDKSDAGTRVHPKYFETEGHDQLDSLGADGLSAVQALADAKEWCRLNGTVAVAKIPGRFFIRAHHGHLPEARQRESRCRLVQHNPCISVFAYTRHGRSGTRSQQQLWAYPFRHHRLAYAQGIIRSNPDV